MRRFHNVLRLCPSRLTINLHTLIMHDFSLWPVFSNSVRYHIKGVHLVYESQETCLPSELTSRCAFLHTLDLSNWRRLKSVSGLGQCGSLHTLDLSYCSGLTDVSGLGQCGSLHTLDLRSCRGDIKVPCLGSVVLVRGELAL